MAEEIRVRRLFDEFAQRYARGERPDVRDYLTRAGEQADELGRLLDRYLASVPPPPPAAEHVEMMRAWLAGEPPLLGLRRERGVPRARVVDALLAALGFAAEKRAKVARYYHRLETGQLDTARVDRRVFAVLRELLGTGVDLVAAWHPPPAPEKAYLRAPEAAPAAALSIPPAEEGERDEVDEAFTAGR